MEHEIDCPYCGQRFTCVLDPSVPEQTYTEDCFVCCQPIIFSVTFDFNGGLLNIDTLREDD